MRVTTGRWGDDPRSFDELHEEPWHRAAQSQVTTMKWDRAVIDGLGPVPQDRRKLCVSCAGQSRGMGRRPKVVVRLLTPGQSTWRQCAHEYRQFLEEIRIAGPDWRPRPSSLRTRPICGGLWYTLDLDYDASPPPAKARLQRLTSRSNSKARKKPQAAVPKSLAVLRKASIKLRGASRHHEEAS